MKREAPEREIWADPVHESLSGTWWPLAEYWPKKTWNSQTKTYEFRAGHSTSRIIPEDALIHESALKRLRQTDLKYEPANISFPFRHQVSQLVGVPVPLPNRYGKITPTRNNAHPL